MTTAHMTSHGRGGAGNIKDNSKSPRLTAADLQTPTLKTNVYTTGRGGSGNMARNVDPAEARKRQDVEAVPRRPSAGAQHYGRGGAANVFKEDLSRVQSNGSAIDDTLSRKSSTESRKSLEQLETLAAKGKAFLFGKK